MSVINQGIELFKEIRRVPQKGAHIEQNLNYGSKSDGRSATDRTSPYL